MKKARPGLLNKFILANLGHCPYCMSKAFQATFIAWGVFFATLILGVPSSTVIWTELAAMGLTGLWIAHLIAFAFRASAAEYHSEQSTSARRGFLLSFGRAVAFAAVATATPAFAAPRGCPPEIPIDCGKWCCRSGCRCGVEGYACICD